MHFSLKYVLNSLNILSSAPNQTNNIYKYKSSNSSFFLNARKKLVFCALSERIYFPTHKRVAVFLSLFWFASIILWFIWGFGYLCRFYLKIVCKMRFTIRC